MSITFALQIAGSAFGDDIDAMTEVAVRAEQEGFTEIRVADHPGTSFDPFVLLSHFSARTSTIRLGTYVLNMGVRHPVDVALAATSLDAISGGRFTLGVGAGHTPREWTDRGVDRPNVDGRIGRFLESVDVLPRLLAGEQVDFTGTYLNLRDAVISKPAPVQSPIPILVGGSNRRLLRCGGAHADIVGVTGLGKTKADGHTHEVTWQPGANAVRAELVAAAAADAGRPAPQMDALVQGLVITDDRERTAEKIAETIDGVSPADALENPFLLIGTPEFLADQMLDFRERYGITSYCVRPDALDPTVQIMGSLRE